MRNWSNCVGNLGVQGQVPQYTTMSPEVVRLFSRIVVHVSCHMVSRRHAGVDFCPSRLMNDNYSTTPERMDLIREEYIRQRLAARDAAVFQEAAARATEGK